MRTQRVRSGNRRADWAASPSDSASALLLARSRSRSGTHRDVGRPMPHNIFRTSRRDGLRDCDPTWTVGADFAVESGRKACGRGSRLEGAVLNYRGRQHMLVDLLRNLMMLKACLFATSA